MTVIKNSTILPCTPEEAFDYLPDLRNELEWNPDCTLMEKITDGPVALGTKFRAQWVGSPVVEVEIVDYERPRMWKAKSTSRRRWSRLRKAPGSPWTWECGRTAGFDSSSRRSCFSCDARRSPT
jgi:hypothetical protein